MTERARRGRPEPPPADPTIIGNLYDEIVPPSRRDAWRERQKVKPVGESWWERLKRRWEA